MSSSPRSAISPETVTFHDKTADAVIGSLASSRSGLAGPEAARRLELHGPNTLPRGRRDGPLDLLWRQINNPLIWILLVSAAVAFVADPEDGAKNGLVILVVVVLNALIGFFQEYKAGQAIDALSRMVPHNVHVLRAGVRMSIPAEELVPGDVVLLASGDRVPADLRLFEVKNLQIQESALTGESVPVPKTIPPLETDLELGDRTNLAFAGSLVTFGTGSGIVVATARHTELGRISSLLQETIQLETPLTKSLEKIGFTISVAIVAASALLLVVGSIRTMNVAGIDAFTAVRETAIFAIALAVGAIPEGLPAILSIALAVGVQRMARRRAIIRKLPAVETLGSTSVICSDKTGTLTRNEMTVQALWTPHGHDYHVTGIGYRPDGRILSARATEEDPDVYLHRLLIAGALCNDSAVSLEGDTVKTSGDPTEIALVVSALKGGFDPVELRRVHARIDCIPFESDYQFMATLHEIDGESVAFVKGAPEVLLPKCKDAPPQTHAKVEEYAARGMRVLAFARKRLGTGLKDLTMAHVEEGGLELLGLQAMIDPPREEAVTAIAACQRAGIAVKMITGDHLITAGAIGEQIGIHKAGQPSFSGREIGKMSDEELAVRVKEANVFARVAPEHKLRLVKAIQASGSIVAMTGDGVNDAPALKQANIGVAMGITGTSVSKEASDVILTDDNFASIAAAVEEGRRVYDNLIKSLAFVLPANLGLAFILIWAVMFFPFDPATKELLLPVSPTQLLWINLVSAVALALPLAFEAPERNLMSRGPRDPDAPLLGRFMIFRTVTASLLMAAVAVVMFEYVYADELSAGVDAAAAVAEAQTIAVTTVIFFQIFYLLNCRSLLDSILEIGIFSNPTVFLGIGAMTVLHLVFVYAEPMNGLFGTKPIEAKDLLLSAAAGALILPVISLEKLVRNRWPGAAAQNS